MREDCEEEAGAEGVKPGMGWVPPSSWTWASGRLPRLG